MGTIAADNLLKNGVLLEGAKSVFNQAAGGKLWETHGRVTLVPKCSCLSVPFGTLVFPIANPNGVPDEAIPLMVKPMFNKSLMDKTDESSMKAIVEMHRGVFEKLAGDASFAEAAKTFKRFFSLE